MTGQDKILELLKGSSRLTPVRGKLLGERCGMTTQALDDTLFSMLGKKLIEKDFATLDGITQQVFWLPGSADVIPAFITPPPENDNMIEEKSKALKILEFLEQNPKSSAAVIMKATGVLSVDSYIPSYLQGGEVIKERPEGSTKFVWSLKPGMSAQQIYDAHRKGRSGRIKPAAQPLSNGIVKDVALKVSQENLLRQSSGTIQVQPLVAVDPAKCYGAFRAAYTSDGTLMLFGVAWQPIELSRDDTEALFDFIGPQLNLVE